MCTAGEERRAGRKRRFRKEEERGEGKIAIVVFSSHLDLLNSDALLKVFAADHVG